MGVRFSYGDLLTIALCQEALQGVWKGDFRPLPVQEGDILYFNRDTLSLHEVGALTGNMKVLPVTAHQ